MDTSNEAGEATSAADGRAEAEAEGDGPDTSAESESDEAKGGGPDPSVESESNGTESTGDESGPTPQSAALRRQQRYVGLGGAALAGLALAVGTVQRFPDAPAAAALAGLAGTVLVLWVVRRSIFPGGSATGENTEDGA